MEFLVLVAAMLCAIVVTFVCVVIIVFLVFLYLERQEKKRIQREKYAEFLATFRTQD